MNKKASVVLDEMYKEASAVRRTFGMRDSLDKRVQDIRLSFPREITNSSKRKKLLMIDNVMFRNAKKKLGFVPTDRNTGLSIIKDLDSPAAKRQARMELRKILNQNMLDARANNDIDVIKSTELIRGLMSKDT